MQPAQHGDRRSAPRAVAVAASAGAGLGLVVGVGLLVAWIGRDPGARGPGAGDVAAGAVRLGPGPSASASTGASSSARARTAVVGASVRDVSGRDRQTGEPGRLAVDGAASLDDSPAAAASLAAPRSSPGPSPRAPNRAASPWQRAAVAAALADLEALYGPQPELAWEEARALVAHREEARVAILRRLGDLGPGGAAALGEGIAAGPGLRSELLLVEALGQVGDADAAGSLGQAYAGASSFEVRRAALAACGRRPEPAAIAVLAAIARAEPDTRLRADAVASIAAAGERGSEPLATAAAALLVQRASGDTDLDLREEAARALGRIPGEPGRAALAEIAGAVAEPRGVRAAALHTLARAHGAAALDTLAPLLASPDEAIRRDAVEALGRVTGEQALALLYRAATEDPSPDVRARAIAAAAALR